MKIINRYQNIMFFLYLFIITPQFFVVRPGTRNTTVNNPGDDYGMCFCFQLGI